MTFPNEGLLADEARGRVKGEPREVGGRNLVTGRD